MRSASPANHSKKRGGVVDLALGLGERLALLVGHDPADALGVGAQQVRGPAKDAAALDGGGLLPLGERVGGGVDRARRTSSTVAFGTVAMVSPVAGFVTSNAPPSLSTQSPPISMRYSVPTVVAMRAV